MNKLLFLMVCIVCGTYATMNAQGSFAVGHSTRQESNPVMKSRLSSTGNTNLIIVGLQDINRDNVINVTETTPAGGLIRTDNFTLQFPSYPNVTGELISDMIIDRNNDIVIYGRCLFGNAIGNTNRPEPFILKIDGETRTIDFCTTLRLADPGNALFRGFTTSNIIEYHTTSDDATGENYYYVAAVTYRNNATNPNTFFANTDQTYFINGNARLYVARIDFSNGAFVNCMHLLEGTTQNNANSNVDLSNSGLMLASGNRIFAYGYYGNASATNPLFPVKPYIYQIDPTLASTGGSFGLLAKYYFNSTTTSNAFQEGLHKIIEVPGSSNEFYMYGFDFEQSTARYRCVISRATLTPPVILGNNFGTIALSTFMYKTPYTTTVGTFGDIIAIPNPGNADNVLFTYTETVTGAQRIRLTNINGNTGSFIWSGRSVRTILNERTWISAINNKIYCSSSSINPTVADYYVLNPQIWANRTSVPTTNLCYQDVPLTPTSAAIANDNHSAIQYWNNHDDVTIVSDLATTTAAVTYTQCTECAAASPSSTIIIPNGTIINTDRLWGSIGTAQKYYIEGSLVIDNAILDITNIDVIFAPCAQITFQNYGRLRANNSVFRPCIESDFWYGINFIQSRDNKIEGCIFKNASVGLMFDQNSVGNIANNQFFNCYRGIEINGNLNFNNPISNNKFIVDRLLPERNECINNLPALQCFGVILNNSIIPSEISQNQFLHNLDPSKNILMTGIKALNSSFNASENMLTNMYRAFEINGDDNGIWRIINNKIEFTRIYSNTTNLSSIQAHQIYILGNVYRAGNEISKNTIKKTESQILPFAIGITLDPLGNGTLTSTNRVCNLAIRENYIEGFHYGIYAYKTINVLVTKNELKNSTGTGITFYESNNMIISCNVVDMLNDMSTVKYGIQVTNCNTAAGPLVGKIHSNCVFNTESAIYITYTPLLNPVPSTPEIRNNYLYNYLSYGLYIDNMASVIGDATFDGMNSFISNNATAVDIFASNPINVSQMNNYSNKAFNFVGIPTPPNTVNSIKYSVASCANQNQHMQGGTNFNGTYNNLLDCENLDRFSPEQPVVIISDLVSPPKDKYEMMYLIQGDDWKNSPKLRSESWISKINQNNELDQETKNQLKYLVYYKINDRESINKMVLDLKNSSDYFYLEAVKKGFEPIDSNKLLRIAQQESFTQTCYFLLSTVNGQYSFNSVIVEPELPASRSALGMDKPYKNMNIYPNPTNDGQVFIDINTPRQGDFKTISIVDFMGMEVFSSKVYLMNGTLQIDISHLGTGVYTIVLSDANGVANVGKLVRL